MYIATVLLWLQHQIVSLVLPWLRQQRHAMASQGLQHELIALVRVFHWCCFSYNIVVCCTGGAMVTT